MSYGPSTIDRARGRWKDVLPRLGVDRKFLRNRHGPCPICSGKDRYRFDDKDGDGTYFCNQCGAGTGIILLRKLHGWDHATACRYVDEIVGAAALVSSKPPSDRNGASKRGAIEEVLREANAPEIVERYLRLRGLSVSSEVLRGHPACPYFDSSRKLIGSFPAVVAPIVGPDGEIESVHRTYLAEVTPRKKFLPPVRTIKGAAVRLFRPDGRLVVCEGIETSLAVQQMTGLAVWSVLDAGNLRDWTPPDGISRLAVYGDNDSSFVGQDAAYALAKRLAAAGISVSVHIPRQPNSDWLDVLNGGGRP